MIPFENIHNNSSALRCPMRLSQTTSILKGGSSSGKVILTESPSCQLFHSSRFCSAPSTSFGGGKVSSTAVSSPLSQGWSTSLVARLTPRTRTSPLEPDGKGLATWLSPGAHTHEIFVSALRLAASSLRDMAPSGRVPLHLRSTPLSPNSHLRCKRARSTFFGCGIRVNDLHNLALALPLDDAGLAPATIPLPFEARLF